MAVIIDGTSGVSTPGVTDTGNLSVAGSTTLTTPLPVASGGTGATSLSGIAVGNLTGGSAGTIPYQSTVGTTAMLATGTSGQALISNGSLAAPSWGTPSLATTATNLAGGAQGSVPYQSAAGTTALLAAGTNGQVLTSAGAGANPTWSTPTPGGLTLISTTNVASGSASAYWTISTGINSTYNNYMIVFNWLKTTTNSGYQQLYMQMYSGGWISTSSYAFTATTINPSGGTGSGSYNGTASYILAAGPSPSGGYGIYPSTAITGTTYLKNVNVLNSNQNVYTEHTIYANSGYGAPQAFFAGGSLSTSTAVTQVRFYMSSGDPLYGSVSLYGMLT